MRVGRAGHNTAAASSALLVLVVPSVWLAISLVVALAITADGFNSQRDGSHNASPALSRIV